MPDESVDAALDELYRSDPADFVALRTQLAARLRTAGDKAGAAEVKGARRPSTSAWALNQLARREPQLVEDLLERSDELQAAQTRALTGTADAMREASRAYRDAIDAASVAALAILGARANDSFRGEIAATLRAAAVDAEVGGQLRRGRLVREAVSSEFGFPDATGLTLVPDPPRSTTRPAPKPAKGRAEHRASPELVEAANVEREAQARRQAQVEREAKAERAAQRKADLARRNAALRRAERAEAEASRTRERIEKLERDLDRERQQLRAADDQSRAARTEAAQLSTTLD